MNRSTSPRRCAIVQLEAFHEEIIPSLVHALNRSGFRPTVYVNDRCLNRGDVFAGLTLLDFELVYLPLLEPADLQSLASRIKAAGNEFVLLSTFQFEPAAEWANKLGLPLIGVVHNAEFFLASRDCTDMLKSDTNGLICLAPHVAVFLHQRLPRHLIDNVAVVESVYWGEPGLAGRTSGSGAGNRRIVAIPGRVQFETRGFEELVEALSSGEASAPLKRLVFSVLGGGRDRARLKALVSEKGVEDSFHFAPLGTKGMVHYPDYKEALRRATLIHPLASLLFTPYREHKITSAIPTAAGFGLPIILDRWTARTYRVPCIVSDASVRASVELIANLDNSEITAQSKEVSNYRDMALERNASEMARLIGRLQQDNHAV